MTARRTDRRKREGMRVKPAVKFGSYAAAMLIVGFIAFAEEVLHAPIDDKSRFLALLVPVAVATWVGGIGPGLLGLALASLVGASFLPPRYSLVISSPSDVISMILFVVVSLLLIGIIESLRRSKEDLAASESKVRKLNADLNDSLGAKEEALQRQKRFTSDASHELKTPLTAIRARSGIALSNPADIEELVEHIVSINRSTDVMISVVQDLLLLAASDEGQLRLRKEPTSVRILVDDALASVPAGKHRVTIKAESDFEIDCDPSAVTRVIVNILQNAIVHTPEGDEIRISSSQTGDLALITITDEGSGIPEEHLGRIFDRFHRADSSRDRESGGSGLGLAIAKAIIEAHGGTIALESTFGKGTSVTLALPKIAIKKG